LAKHPRLPISIRPDAFAKSTFYDEIGRRNASGYDRAASLLSDLQALAAEGGSQDDFGRRLASICARHERKGQFIRRLTGLGLSGHGRKV